MHMKRILLTALTVCAVLTASAQNYADMIKANPAMGAANLMNYHFEKTDYTPAPKGYEAFYISHYGRHGSRYDSNDKYASAVWPLMKKADSLGLLSKVGKAFYKDFNALMEEQQGMFGMLTSLGAREHRGIAERMAANFPKVFKGKNGRDVVYCQSSIYPRCLLSMTNFTHSLDRNTDGVDFTFVTGDKYYQYLAYHPEKRPALELAKAKEDVVRRQTMKPMELIEYFFNDAEKACEIIGDPYSFEMNLYLASCVGHLSDHGVCLLSYFPEDILVRNWEVRNPRFYLAYGMSNEMSDYQKTVSRRLLADFIRRAEDAVEKDSNIAADLRFGHDTALLPLVGHIGIEGMDNWASFDQVNSVWNSSVSICMASNLQMIFYRNRKNEVIVKLMYNEKETTIPALNTWSGPYYKWSDLKSYFKSLL